MKNWYRECKQPGQIPTVTPGTTAENLRSMRISRRSHTVWEETPVKDYETSYDTTNKNNITNTHKPGTVKISGTKTWDDNINQDGLRPESGAEALQDCRKQEKKSQ